MLHNRIVWNMILMSCALGSVIFAYAAQPRSNAFNRRASTQKSIYLLILSHKAPECPEVADSIASMGNNELWNWGCRSGDHTAYAFVKASNMEAALEMTPRKYWRQVRIEKVDKLDRGRTGVLQAGR